MSIATVCIGFNCTFNQRLATLCIELVALSNPETRDIYLAANKSTE